MIEIKNIEIYGWEAAIRGMRNPMNSWNKSDSEDACCCDDCGMPAYYEIGKNDLSLMQKLAKAGSDHRKFLRMINVTMDITAPLYWWKEFDTYKVGTVANSCSTMHKIHEKLFTIDDFSCEHLFSHKDCYLRKIYCESPEEVLARTIVTLNIMRERYIATGNKDYWWQMIQLLPSSYNQKRTVQLNYETLRNMYFARRHHKLNEWAKFCKEIEKLDYFKEICINDM